MKSRAAICVGPGRPLEIDCVDVAAPQAGQVMIEIKATGLCHSDYHQMDGTLQGYPYPVILGHEGAGVVVEVGSGVTRLAVGDHVIPVSIPECGECINCVSGRTNLCLRFFTARSEPSPFSRNGEPISRYVGGGTFSNYVTVNEIGVAKIRRDAPFDPTCCIGCGVVTGVGSAIKAARVRPGSTVIVFGLGGIGLNVVQGARLAGAKRIIGVDINSVRREPAFGFGATDFVNPREIEGDVVAHLLALTGGGADYAFECVGNTTLLAQAIETVRAGDGVAMVVGAASADATVAIPPRLMLMGRTVTGAVLGNVRPRTELPDFVDLYMDGKIDLDSLVSHRLPLERINEGFEMMKTGEAIRPVIVF